MSNAVLPEAPVRVSVYARIATHCAVGVARILARRSPKRIRAVLTWLSRGTPAATRDQARHARDTILTVSTLCCGGEACLPRSIAVALLCRAGGCWPTWCVGVIAAPPFRAHAWIEAGGEIVDEPIESTFYRKFFSVPAGNG